MALCLGGAYWFSRIPGFGVGGSAWFPGGVAGVAMFTVFLAASAVLMGADAFSTWERANAKRLLETRLLLPGVWLAAMAAAVTAALMPGAILIAFWPAIGAWRAEFDVLWSPTLVYLGGVAFPMLWAGACSGLGMRVLLRSELAALTAALAILIPLLSFRILAAPSAEIFLLASDTFGILIPRTILLRDSLLTLVYPLPVLGLVLLMLPRPRAATPSVKSMLPIGARAWLALGLQLRQSGLLNLVVSAALIFLGMICVVTVLNERRVDEAEIDWSMVVRPSEAPDQIPRARIIHRGIRFEDDAVHLTLTLHPQAWSAVTFGPTLIPLESSTPLYEMGSSGIYLFTGDETLTVRLGRSRGGERLWQRAWHPRYHRFSFLGRWYGSAVGVDFARQEILQGADHAPFEIDAPKREGIEWAAGAATLRERGESVVVTHESPGLPSRLVAGDLVDIAGPTTQTLELKFLVLPKHAVLARQMHVIYADQLTRLGRLFGPQAVPLVLYEVPEQAPLDPMALSTSLLDRLNSLLPRYNDYGSLSDGEFLHVFEPIHAGITREVFASAFSEVEEPLLLREALASYIHEYAMGKGSFRGLGRSLRRDAVLVPWELVRGRAYPFDVQDAELPAWEGRFSPSLPRERLLKRATAFHHMLRGVVGDEKWREGVQRCIADNRGGVLTRDGYREAMEAAHGESLRWFFDQWLEDGVMPHYEIVEGRAFLIEDRATRAVDYQVRATIANRGTGRMPVPWVLLTEGELIKGVHWLESGEETEIVIPAPERPVAFELDPNGWIAQLVPPGVRVSGSAASANHQRILFKTVAEL